MIRNIRFTILNFMSQLHRHEHGIPSPRKSCSNANFASTLHCSSSLFRRVYALKTFVWNSRCSLVVFCCSFFWVVVYLDLFLSVVFWKLCFFGACKIADCRSLSLTSLKRFCDIKALQRKQRRKTHQ
ncbi:hypothetical protein BDV38DRAFT_162603 [Aspergillus pseudotamarii]|uniref:Uncharacterized protein n=1 Tax=Aspergillus pseudotamarii TaxID=132259 RepID=A0A5N6SL29_ASPPS|nr:uncharacterized protein BDV38DRAFT_162603 [Aspergillus pseudotamarii]KAE8134401.1 hypothetical protein BDV38DRAFT_162603 [Aspergillus pseudotamarii]